MIAELPYISGWMLYVDVYLGIHNERSVFGSGQPGLRRHLSENMRPATKNYCAERGRSISFLEAPKFSLKKDSGKCLRHVCDKNNRCMFLICISHDTKVIRHNNQAWRAQN